MRLLFLGAAVGAVTACFGGWLKLAWQEVQEDPFLLSQKQPRTLRTYYYEVDLPCV